MPSNLADAPALKRPYRLADPKAIRRKVRRDRSCRACGCLGNDGHHILLRSKGGDDVEENIATLCHADHMLFHMSTSDDARKVAAEIGRKLTADEIGYVVGRLGDSPGREYLLAYYCISRDDPRYSEAQSARDNL